VFFVFFLNSEIVCELGGGGGEREREKEKVPILDARWKKRSWKAAS
jgi:hypothetical protein